VQVEQLASVGNSFYKGLTFELRRRFGGRGDGLGGSLRAAYTLSRLVDDGVVNTSSALRAGDFRSERAPSLLDRRHRLAVSATLDAPRAFGRLRLATVLRLASGAPFNLSLGGDDRNLDDVSNDRPLFNGDLRLLRWRRPGSPLDPRLLASLSLPLIGQTGDLPRNAGRGPALFTLDLNLARDFRLGEHTRLRPTIEIDNVLNKTVFTFGAEFINLNALRPDATDAQRQAFADTFLVPTHTLRPRTMRSCSAAPNPFACASRPLRHASSKSSRVAIQSSSWMRLTTLALSLGTARRSRTVEGVSRRISSRRGCEPEA